MNSTQRTLIFWVANQAPIVLFVTVLLVFGGLAPAFLSVGNLINILVQSASTAIVAVGMTFVLLTAGVDLSVGSIMLASGAVAGKLALKGCPLWLGMVAIVLVGVVFGGLNAVLVTRLRVLAFIATIGTLYIGRGFGLWITETRAMNLPENFLWLGQARIAGVPAPLILLIVIVLAAHWTLTQTPFGRQVYAVGSNPKGARQAGLNTDAIIAAVYVISGFCAAVGGIVSLSQLGAVSPTFGNQKEFAAIAAAVLGGTSLFGGRGGVLPGTFLGAVLIQTVENGLVILNTDPYLYPMVTSGIIFLAVLLDRMRAGLQARLTRRNICVDFDHA